jgi:glutamyl-tRNA reductase
VVTCTAAGGHVVTEAAVAQSLRLRSRDADPGPGHGDRTRPVVMLDLALPRNVEAAAGKLPGVQLIDMETIGAAGDVGEPDRAASGFASDGDVLAVRRIVAQELNAYLKADRAASVAPTIVALRAKAAVVVESELARLQHRLGMLDDKTRKEIAQSMGRIADKLLHGPTVRVKDLAGSPGADSYETALRVLFELDLDAVEAIGRPEEDQMLWQLPEAEQ